MNDSSPRFSKQPYTNLPPFQARAKELEATRQPLKKMGIGPEHWKDEDEEEETVHLFWPLAQQPVLYGWSEELVFVFSGRSQYYTVGVRSFHFFLWPQPVSQGGACVSGFSLPDGSTIWLHFGGHSLLEFLWRITPIPGWFCPGFSVESGVWGILEATIRSFVAENFCLCDVILR